MTATTDTPTIPAPQAVITEMLRTLSRSYANRDCGYAGDNEASVCGWADGIDINGLHYYADIEATAVIDGEDDTYDCPGWSEATVEYIDYLDGKVRDDDDNIVATLDFDVRDFIGERL